MGLDAAISKLKSRTGGRRELTTGPEDISGGVEQAIGNVPAATLYLAASGAVEVTVEFSPDAGKTWYEPTAESPVAFNAAGEDIVHIEYHATDIRLTGSNGTAVEAQVREVV